MLVEEMAVMAPLIILIVLVAIALLSVPLGVDSRNLDTRRAPDRWVGDPLDRQPEPTR
jgi:hypothetical protein